jgi:NADH-quinone oxidoreductase subunit H
MILVGVSLSFSIIWVRGSFPSYRYDSLIILAWKIYLPLSLGFLIFYMVLGGV